MWEHNNTVIIFLALYAATVLNSSHVRNDCHVEL